MQVIDALIQKIRKIPEAMREPHISNKEIEQMTNNMLRTQEYEHMRRMEVR